MLAVPADAQPVKVKIKMTVHGDFSLTDLHCIHCSYLNGNPEILVSCRFFLITPRNSLMRSKERGQVLISRWP
jgi:hypothetical protein